MNLIKSLSALGPYDLPYRLSASSVPIHLARHRFCLIKYPPYVVTASQLLLRVQFNYITIVWVRVMLVAMYSHSVSEHSCSFKSLSEPP